MRKREELLKKFKERRAALLSNKKEKEVFEGIAEKKNTSSSTFSTNIISTDALVSSEVVEVLEDQLNESRESLLLNCTIDDQDDDQVQKSTFKTSKGSIGAPSSSNTSATSPSAQLLEMRQRLQMEMELQSEELNNHSDRLKQLFEENAVLQNDNTNLQNDNTNLKSDNQNLADTNAKLQKQIDLLHKNLEEQKTRHDTEMEAHRQRLDAQLEIAGVETTEMEQRVALLTQSKEEAEKRASKLGQVITERDALVTKLEMDLENEKQANQVIRSEMKTASDAQSQLENTENDALNTKHEALLKGKDLKINELECQLIKLGQQTKLEMESQRRRMDDQLKIAQDEAEQSMEQLKQLLNQKSQFDAKLISCQTLMDGKDREIHLLEERVQDLETQLSLSQKQAMMRQTDIDMLNNTKTSTEKELQKKIEALRRLEAQVENHSKESQKRESSHLELVNSIEGEMKRQQTVVANLELEISQMRNEKEQFTKDQEVWEEERRVLIEKHEMSQEQFTKDQEAWEEERRGLIAKHEMSQEQFTKDQEAWEEERRVLIAKQKMIEESRTEEEIQAKKELENEIQRLKTSGRQLLELHCLQTNDLQTLTVTAEALESELQTLKRENEAMSKDVEKSKKRTQSHETELLQSQTILLQTQKEKDQILKDLATTKDSQAIENVNHEAKVKQLEKEIILWKQELGKHEDSEQVLSLKLEKMKLENKELEQNLSLKTERLKNAHNESQKWQNQVFKLQDTLRKEKDMEHTLLQKSKLRCASLETEVQQLKSDYVSLQTKFKRVSTTLVKLETEKKTSGTSLALNGFKKNNKTGRTVTDTSNENDSQKAVYGRIHKVLQQKVELRETQLEKMVSTLESEKKKGKLMKQQWRKEKGEKEHLQNLLERMKKVGRELVEENMKINQQLSVLEQEREARKQTMMNNFSESRANHIRKVHGAEGWHSVDFVPEQQLRIERDEARSLADRASRELENLKKAINLTQTA